MNNICVFVESPRVSEAVSNLKNDIGGILLERRPLHSGEFILREITYTITHVCTLNPSQIKSTPVQCYRHKLSI